MYVSGYCRLKTEIREPHYYANPIYSWSIKILSYKRYQCRRIYTFFKLSLVQRGFSSYFSETNNNLFITCHFFPEKASKFSFHWPGLAHLQLPWKVVLKKKLKTHEKSDLPLTCFLLELSSIHCRQLRVFLMINTFSIIFFRISFGYGRWKIIRMTLYISDHDFMAPTRTFFENTWAQKCLNATSKK